MIISYFFYQCTDSIGKKSIEIQNMWNSLICQQMFIFVLISLRNLLIHTLKLKDNQKNIHFLLINVPCSHVVMISSCQKHQHDYSFYNTHPTILPLRSVQLSICLQALPKIPLRYNTNFGKGSQAPALLNTLHQDVHNMHHHIAQIFFFYLRESGTTFHMKTFLMSLSSFPRQFNCEILVLKQGKIKLVWQWKK